MAWDAPWGRGRPGWHIECSAMAEQLLGVELDVHGGGSDLVFPHHENEAAQTLAARGRPLARIWTHNGMLQLDDAKMAKSEGNIRGLGAVVEEVGRDALILYFVAGHYRQPLAYSRERLEEAARGVERIREAGRRVSPGDSPGGPRAAARRVLRRAGRRLQHRQGAGHGLRLDPRGQPRARARWGTRTCARCSACWGWRTCSSAGAGAPPELVELAERRARGAGRARLRRGRPAARRAARGGLGGPRRPRRAGARARGVIVYGRNAVREALRAAAHGASRVGRARRARVGSGGAVEVTRASGEEIAALLRLRRPSGRVRGGLRVPLSRRARAAGRARPGHRGARRGHRPAEPRRGRPLGGERRGHGARDPRAPLGRGDPGGLQGLRRRRRAPGHRPRAQRRRLPRRGQAGGLLVLRRGRRRAPRATASPTTAAASCWCSARRAAGLRPRVRESCDVLVSLPLRGRVESLNVERHRGGAAVRDLAPAA